MLTNLGWEIKKYEHYRNRSRNHPHRTDRHQCARRGTRRRFLSGCAGIEAAVQSSAGPGVLRLRWRATDAVATIQARVGPSWLDSVFQRSRHSVRPRKDERIRRALRRRTAPDRKNANARSVDDLLPRLGR